MTACYLMLELSVCISTAMTWCFETRKEHADFIMMVVHHACTISLICFSMYSKNYNMGVSTANLHDISDIFLEFSKMIYYLGFTQTSKQGCYLAVWVQYWSIFDLQLYTVCYRTCMNLYEVLYRFLYWLYKF
ncbi:Ceramide_synthetase [Hexamita inflata]|uniref:Ceramide synthetase n=1 Tax=Hexamita inflata TaxID=28002 RepID=A0AA86PRK5_9EUKA|nr:Ceramide synthetase [Hexamita inflata]CAI9972974.1 Ceramide synthetase [Hexamita inflata]